MKKLLILLLCLISLKSVSQTWYGTGTANLQRTPTAKGWFYRNNMGAIGNVTWYTAPQLDSLLAISAGSGVTLFNTRAGAVVPLSADYSSFYPLLNGTGATGTWGIGITGNSGTVTNGVYTTTFNALGDARYPLLSGAYVNPSWITSLPWSKITGTPTTLSGYGITDAQPLNAKLTSIAALANASGVLTNNGSGVFSYTTPTGGTVTSLTDNTTNGVAVTWANRTTTPTPTVTLGAITPTSTNGVSATTMAFNDATSSIQTQLNGKQASLGFTPENVANKATTYATVNNTLYPSLQLMRDSTLHPNKNLSDIVNKATALLNLGAAPSTGSTSYIPNNSTGTASVGYSYNIDGTAVIGSTLRVNGNIGIGNVPQTNAVVRLTLPITGNAQSEGFAIASVVQSGVTTRANGFSTSLGTQATAFTLGILSDFVAGARVLGAGSTVNNHYGFEVMPSFATGAVLTTAFNGGIAASAGAYNFYASGSANNYMNGTLMIGSTTPTSGAPKLDVTGSIGSTTLATSQLVATDANKILVSITALPSGVTATTQSAGDNSTKVETTAGTLLNISAATDNQLSKTANYTIVAGDWVTGKNSTLDLEVDCTGGAVIITMPSASAMQGKTVYITKIDASVNGVTINTIGYGGGNTLIAQGNSRTFKSNGTVISNR